jgi:hypothetical protein
MANILIVAHQLTPLANLPALSTLNLTGCSKLTDLSSLAHLVNLKIIGKE